MALHGMAVKQVLRILFTAVRICLDAYRIFRLNLFVMYIWTYCSVTNDLLCFHECIVMHSLKLLVLN